MPLDLVVVGLATYRECTNRNLLFAIHFPFLSDGHRYGSWILRSLYIFTINPYDVNTFFDSGQIF